MGETSMPKTFWAVAVTAWFCLLVTLSACSKTALDRAADLEAQKWWDKTVVKCGQTYYARNRWINMAAVRPNMSREQLEKDGEKKE
jgi:predicted cobalt transporter CbtA